MTPINCEEWSFEGFWYLVPKKGDTSASGKAKGSKKVTLFFD